MAEAHWATCDTVAQCDMQYDAVMLYLAMAAHGLQSAPTMPQPQPGKRINADSHRAQHPMQHPVGRVLLVLVVR
jgi:hypothetical protein